MCIRSLLMLLAGSFSCAIVNANNLSLNELQLLDASKVALSLGWENAWFLDPQTAPGNHDAVWLFAKINYGSGFEHLQWSLDQSGSLQEVFAIETSADQRGLMIRPANAGTYNSISDVIHLHLDHAVASENFDLRLFAVEMVYVPEGGFLLGDAASQGAFREAETDHAFMLSSEQEIPVDSIGTSLWSFNDKPDSDIPASFPKGFEGFYCMKHELSQQLYADFLNCLSTQQQDSRTPGSPFDPPLISAFSDQNRNAIQLAVSANDESPARYACNLHLQDDFGLSRDGQSLAANFLNWNDLCAWLDWAALRPMTEFEYEKACRGKEQTVDLEFAWGTSVADPVMQVYDAGMSTEYFLMDDDDSSGAINYQYSPVNGPVRCGFAATESSNRVDSGASYYGILELSGNLWEQVVSCLQGGLDFVSNHGDGRLSEYGDADVESWPSMDTGGAGLRGGAWNSGDFAGFRDASVSDRYYIGFFPEERRNTLGGRGVRKL